MSMIQYSIVGSMPNLNRDRDRPQRDGGDCRSVDSPARAEPETVSGSALAVTAIHSNRVLVVPIPASQPIALTHG
jgi:hypothetical protein